MALPSNTRPILKLHQLLHHRKMFVTHSQETPHLMTIVAKIAQDSKRVLFMSHCKLSRTVIYDMRNIATVC